MIALFYIILAMYALFIFAFLVGFLKLPTQHLQSKNTPETAFSVVIPFRNEAKRLPQLLYSIKKLNYPNELVTFYFVDDDSEDDSVSIIQKFASQNAKNSIILLKNERVSGSPKKDAITTAIKKITTSWIVTTDADCLLPKNWLLLLNETICHKQPKMIAAPVAYVSEKSFLAYFQQLDFLSLQFTTIGTFGIGKPFMCNGANLAYQKDAFLQVNGFSGNDTIASGDDVFLLEKFVKNYENDLVYLKATEATVQTFATTNFKALIEQRIRWASKSKSYSLNTGKLIGSLVLIVNFSLLMLPVFTVLGYLTLAEILIITLFKFVVDLVAFLPIMYFLKIPLKPFYTILSLFFYPLFLSYIAVKSTFSTYNWKGRAFRK